MSELVSRTRRVRRSSMVAGLSLVGLVVSLGGCASNQANQSYYRPVNPPSRLAAAPGAVEMEADGREAQAPASQRSRNEPDDPREPFSPNYGARPAKRAALAPVVPYAAAQASQAAGVLRARPRIASAE